MFIVSDEVLERRLCTQCRKYLSARPIKVYPNRGIKCGRCSSPVDAGVVSLFGILAEGALFRCVNRFDGCNQLLTYSEVAKHETFCVAKQLFECPACVNVYKGSSYDMYIHFKEEHNDSFLINHSEINIDIENELQKSYLYCTNDLLFFVTVCYHKGEQELTLNILHLGSDQDSSEISQNFTLYSLDRKIRHRKSNKSSCSVSEGNLKSFKVNVSADDFPRNIVICKFDVNTERVENLVALSNYFKQRKPCVDETLQVKPSNTVEPAVNETRLASCKYLPVNETDGFRRHRYPVEVYRPQGTSISGPDSAATTVPSLLSSAREPGMVAAAPVQSSETFLFSRLLNQQMPTPYSDSLQYITQITQRSRPSRRGRPCHIGPRRP